MMNIDEAIKRSEEAEKKERELYDICPATETEWLHCDGTKNCKVMLYGKNMGCLKIAEEHKQIAEWLKELKQLKEQEPCEDAVSRKEVLEQTYNWSKDEFLRTTDPFDYLRKRVNGLPSVTPTQKWIPTSEHQPKENGNYLAFYRASDGTASLDFMMVDHCNAGGGWLHEESKKKSYKKVMAWMPLPEPYKEEMEIKE